jgi:L-2-hydroxyglutarate oxidase LhgO
MSAPVAVVGGGVVGLAIARALALAGRSVVVVEAEQSCGTSTSARNSGVIHAGLYNGPETLKTRLCVRGAALLYAYCEQRGVAHSRLGKLLIAPAASQAAELAALLARAQANGVQDLQLLTEQEASALEPLVRAEGGALLSPNSGVVDVRQLVSALRADVEAHGGVVRTGQSCEGVARRGDGYTLSLRGADGSLTQLEASVVVNSAGLGAQRVSACIAGLPPASIPPLHLAKGNWFTWDVPGTVPPFQRLVYPLPPADGAGLGVHATLTLDGTLRFGPDVQWIESVSETTSFVADAARVSAFEASIRDYLPSLPSGALKPAMAGVRAKLSGPGQPPADFAIQGPECHGVPGLVCLYGIESPGLTSCLAIAEHVCAVLA